MLIKLPGGEWVNPQYVTAIEVVTVDTYTNPPKQPWTKIWVVKDAGYGTGSIMLQGDRADEIAELLNQKGEHGI
jgi:hypothetical protein